MELMPRYKQTEVGFIPADWETIPLGRLTASVEYGSSAKSNPTGRCPVLRMGNLQGGQIDWADLVYTDDATEITKYTLHPGDVLFNRTNTIELVGKAALFKGERAAIFAGYLIRIKVDGKLLDSRFLNYVLNTEFSKRYSAKVLSVAVGQANINGQKLRTYPVPVPPTKAEQEAIAEALSDVDALIESLEQLIAKKRDIKQGAMQDLLSGRRRLPGFHGEWIERTISDDIELLTGFPFPSDRYSRAGIRLLRGSNVKRGETDWSEGLIQYWPSISNEIEEYRLRDGDLVIAMDGSLVGRSYARLAAEDLPALLLQRVARIRSRTIDIGFLTQLIGSDGFVKYCDSVKTVTAIPHISPTDIRNFRIARPLALNEQAAIGEVLLSMDGECKALETKLSKVRLLKNGMMQQLLTGRIRLV